MQKFEVTEFVRKYYQVRGTCPYCGKQVGFELLRLGEEDNCTIHPCPECRKYIHFVNGVAYTRDSCPAVGDG